MIAPSPLNTGDKLGIVAPGRKIEASNLVAARNILSSWGLEVVLSKNIHSTHHAYLAGSDEERLTDLQQMLDDPSIRAIICARGGYGTTRILDKLDFTKFQGSPKWIVGFSDITALHIKLSSLGYESIHGTMPVLFSGKDAQPSISSLKETLFGKPTVIETPSYPMNRTGSSAALLAGGNLSLIVDSLGTGSAIDTEDKILIVEEIDEYKYKIDRMLVQMKRAGKLENLKGFVAGHFTDIKDSTLAFGERIEEIILHHLGDYRYPVAFHYPTGHENPNLSWIQGRLYELSVSNEGTSLKPCAVPA